MTPEQVIQVIENAGGMLQVGSEANSPFMLYYKLGRARHNRNLARRLERAVKKHREEIGFLVCAREFLEGWEPEEGAWLQ